MTLLPHILANFKPKRANRLRAKNVDKRKDRPGNSEAHLAAIRKLPCCIPGCTKMPGGEAHHLKATGNRGGALRSPDKDTLPLCHEHHINGVERVGSRNELRWFEDRGIEALELAAALWMVSPDAAAMTRIILAHKALKP